MVSLSGNQKSPMVSAVNRSELLFLVWWPGVWNHGIFLINEPVFFSKPCLIQLRQWHREESSLDHSNLPERFQVYASIIIINSSRILLCDSQGVCVEHIIIKLSSSLSHFYEYFTLLWHPEGLTQTPSKLFEKYFLVNECKNLAVNLHLNFWITAYAGVDVRVYLWWISSDSVDMFIVICL